MSGFAELEQPYLELFKHIVKYFDDPTTDGYIYSSSIRLIAERGVNVGLVRSGLNWLTEHDFLKIVNQSVSGSTVWELSSKGTAVAYALISGAAETPNAPASNSAPVTFHGVPVVWSGQPSSGVNSDVIDLATLPALDTIPASDRFVTLSDNAPETAELVSKLEELAEAVRGDNRCLSEGGQLFADRDEKLAVQSEVTSLVTSLKLGCIRAGVLVAAVRTNGVLSWIATKAAEGVIRDIAVQTLKLASDFCKNHGLF
jgi:hypothetical protein